MKEPIDFPRELRTNGAILRKDYPYTADLFERAADEIARLRDTVAALRSQPPAMPELREWIAKYPGDPEALVDALTLEIGRLNDRATEDIAEIAKLLEENSQLRGQPPSLPSEDEIHRTLSGVQLFSRINDLLNPPQIEICRYGSDDEEEIVVISRHDTKWKETDLLRNAVRTAQARSIITLMRTSLQVEDRK